MMKYLGLIAGWFLVAVIMLILLVVVAFVPFAGLTPGNVGQAFGIWLLVGLGGLVAGGLYAYFKIKAVVGELKDLAKGLGDTQANVNNFLMELEPVKDGPPLRLAEDGIGRALLQELLDAGFVHEGDFRVEDMPSLEMSGYIHEGKGMTAAMCAMGGQGPWLDLASDFEDGTEYYVSNIQMPMVMDTRPNVIRVMEPGANVAQLLEVYEKNKPSGRVTKVYQGTFKQHFELFWWRDKSWRRARGGTTIDEVRRMHGAGVVGDSQTPDESLREAVEMENQQWNEAWTQVPGKLIDRYLKKAGLREDGDTWYDRHSHMVAAFEGQSLDEFTEYLSERVNNLHQTALDEQGREDPEATQTFKPTGFRPGADGFRLPAAAEGQENALAGARAINEKHPEWFKLVFTGTHPMEYAIYEVSVKQ